VSKLKSLEDIKKRLIEERNKYIGSIFWWTPKYQKQLEFIDSIYDAIYYIENEPKRQKQLKEIEDILK
jgi:hypothetical protein